MHLSNLLPVTLGTLGQENGYIGSSGEMLREVYVVQTGPCHCCVMKSYGRPYSAANIDRSSDEICLAECPGKRAFDQDRSNGQRT